MKFNKISGLSEKSLFNENGAFLLKWSILAKKCYFNKNGAFLPFGDILPPAASPGGLPGGPGMGSHRATSGILDFQEVAQIVRFIKGILRNGAWPAHG